MNKDELCVNCKYWSRKPDTAYSAYSGEWGQCRKSSPTITMWPKTFGDDWCGEWKRMTPVPTVPEIITEKENLKNN